jgi:hypothetical protein
MSPSEIAGLVGGVLGAGTVGGVLGAGILHRWIRPAIREEIGEHEKLATTVESRKVQARAVVQEHELLASTVDARKQLVREVIVDQTSRDDGAIRRHTQLIDERSAGEMRELRATLSTVGEEMAQLRGMIATLLDQMPDRRTPVDTGRSTAPPAPRQLLQPPRHPTDPGKRP